MTNTNGHTIKDVNRCVLEKKKSVPRGSVSKYDVYTQSAKTDVTVILYEQLLHRFSQEHSSATIHDFHTKVLNNVRQGVIASDNHFAILSER